MQFEKLGYSQPWIQVPTSWVYLTGKKCVQKPSVCQVKMRYHVLNQGPGPGPGDSDGVTEGTECKETLVLRVRVLPG